MQPEARPGVARQAMTMARHRHGCDRAGAVAQAGTEQQEVQLKAVPERRREDLLLRLLPSLPSQQLFSAS